MKELLVEIVMGFTALMVTLFAAPYIAHAIVWLTVQPLIWAGDDIKRLVFAGILPCLIILALAFWPERKGDQTDAEGNHHG